MNCICSLVRLAHEAEARKVHGAYYDPLVHGEASLPHALGETLFAYAYLPHAHRVQSAAVSTPWRYRRVPRRDPHFHKAWRCFTRWSCAGSSSATIC